MGAPSLDKARGGGLQGSVRGGFARDAPPGSGLDDQAENVMRNWVIDAKNSLPAKPKKMSAQSVEGFGQRLWVIRCSGRI